MQTAWDIASQERESQLKANDNNPVGLVTGGPDNFHVISCGEGSFKLLPGPEFNSWIFRGQEKFFNPCRPSIYRGDKGKIDIFIDRMRCVQLKHIIYDHPAIVDCRDNLLIGGSRLWIDYEGLSQHYGLSTELMDFSSDPWVAAFFAVSWFDIESQRYMPVRSGSEDGIFYRLNVAMDAMAPGQQVSDIVGMQPLVRPGEQKAFSVRVKKGRCLHHTKNIAFQRFRHDTLVSEKILEKFSSGNDLLPKDPVAKKAAEISSVKVFSRDVFNECASRFLPGVNRGSLIKRLKRKGFAITSSSNLHFKKEDLDVMEKEWRERRDSFCSLIKVRLFSDHYNAQSPA
tara:strand:+ start:225 stop:1250 length:1026 start_codon:yes stop_codon:yes gene_type:complete